MRPAVITVIGPVGPLIWEGVPPKREAKNPSIIAPVKVQKDDDLIYYSSGC